MAAGRLPAPGTEFGPCIVPTPDGKGSDACGHTDCAATRAEAATICRFCGKEIGYETRFYIESDTRQLVHADCLEDNVL